MDEEFFEPYLVKKAPKTAYYIPNFITEEEETYLIKRINEAPKPKWTYLSNRRLQDYGGVPHIKGMIQESIPCWLEVYMKRISDLHVFSDKNNSLKQANHCLINEYLPGQGIMPHLDGPVFTPVISTLSCGSHTLLEFLEEENHARKNICSLLLEARSLIILKEDFYEKYLHTVSEKMEDVIGDDCVNLTNCGDKYKVGDILQRKTRISLTIRNVPKILKCKLFNLNK